MRNERGRELLESVGGAVETSSTMSAGSRGEFVMQTAIADDEAKMGRGPEPMPRWLGTILAWVLEKVGAPPVDRHGGAVFLHVSLWAGPQQLALQLGSTAATITGHQEPSLPQSASCPALRFRQEPCLPGRRSVAEAPRQAELQAMSRGGARLCTASAVHPATTPVRNRLEISSRGGDTHASVPCQAAWCGPQVGPKGVEFAKYSIDYHYIRNYLSVKRRWKDRRAEQHIPEFAKRIVAEYDKDGKVAERASMKLPPN